MKLCDRMILILVRLYLEAAIAVSTKPCRVLATLFKFVISLPNYLLKMGNDNFYDSVAKVIGSFVKEDIKVDNFVFRLHRSFTVLLCVFSAVVLSLSQVR